LPERLVDAAPIGVVSGTKKGAPSPERLSIPRLTDSGLRCHIATEIALINLDAYTHSALEHLTRGGAWALFVLRPARSQKPVKIGRTTDPAGTLYDMSRQSPVPLEMASLLWTCGRPLADRIDKIVRLEFEAANVVPNAGWYRDGAADRGNRAPLISEREVVS
jgi:hypothetical protein